MNLHLVLIIKKFTCSRSLRRWTATLGAAGLVLTGASGCRKAPAAPVPAQPTPAEIAQKAAEEKLKAAVLSQELLKSAGFALVGKDTARIATKADPDAAQTKLWFGVTVRNYAAKPIHAVQGVVNLTDLFGQKIATVGIQVTISTSLQPNDEALWSLSAPYNANDPLDLKLGNTAMKDLHWEWVPRSIMFADGSRLGEGGAFEPGVKLLYDEDLPPGANLFGLSAPASEPGSP